jgi:PAS domain S-box-containing protein
MKAPVVDLSSIRLETVLEDGEFVLYRSRGAAHTTGAGSALVVMPRSEHPRLQTVRMLEHEHSLRDELNPAWAVRSRAQATHDGRAALVFDDPGGEPLVQRAGTPMAVGDVLLVGAGLAAALRQLHGHGLIHKDIKPANVITDWSTGHVWLRGFGIASRFPRERRLPEPPEFISGTLAYMAPEQTGWMNRSIDARSDLYALGVVLYELLTGSLPFTASDPMEWVHGHIARRPVPPAERLHGIPAVISAIAMKLLAKTAEERYQTAAGVESDLRQCLGEWEGRRRIGDFTLGEHDTPDRLLIPEKLYGRAREVDTLLGSFDRIVESGVPELVLVAGFSGIGKSAVVNELHRVLVPPRGHFASGKFDQYKRDIPYATLAVALQNITGRLLGKSDADLAPWRDAFCEALGPNGRLMVDLVPELQHIIGDQPPVPELPPQDAQRRFQLVLRRFIGVFAQPEHPLALFLDDLQWLDAATLDLLEDLLTRSDLQHLMLIGAYRDNEVGAAHPLRRKLETIKAAGGKVAEITLGPLTRAHVGQLIADALRCEPARSAPLAALVHEKTGGNPFFAIQFISSLAEEGMLTFDHDAASWFWDLARIHAKSYTDNVVDLMVGKLSRLSVGTQMALQQLACLGNGAEIAMLSIVCGTSEEQLQQVLWEASRGELIECPADAYRFTHDRVQEAAYSLIPEGLRGEAHVRIGRLLAAHIPLEKREEAIFEIVNQYNRGAALIVSTDEREHVSRLNLLAGKRAKSATAFVSALSYLGAAAALLGEDWWEWRPDLMFDLEWHRAECEFLTGSLGAAEERLNRLSERAATTVDRAAVTCLRVELYAALGQGDRAVDVCLTYLRDLGIGWSPHPTEDEARREYERIQSLLGSRAIENLIDLPLMTDPVRRATLDVLTKFLPAAFFTDAQLFSLAVCRMVNISLEYGHTDASCIGYVHLGIIAGPRFGNYESGYRFGRLGFDLVEQRGLERFRARTCFGFGLVVVWKEHVRAGRAFLRLAFDAANATGDLTYAAYCCVTVMTNLLAAGDPLVDAEREAVDGLAFAQKAQFGLVIDLNTAQLALIRTLRGATPTFGRFDDGQVDEVQFEHHLAGNPGLALAECWYWIRKLQARYLAGDYAAAMNASAKAQPLLWTSSGFIEEAEYQFYSALCRAACVDGASAGERNYHLESLAAHHRQLAVWAENCPENFENRVALVGAEMARLDGRLLDAQDLYEQAIRSARAQEFIHNEALASELAARFYQARGFQKIAHAYLRDARDCYLRWGADGKVRQLDELYPSLRTREPARGPTGTITAPVERLELATVLNVSLAVSGEIELDKLVDRVLRTAIEHAGAERGVLIVPEGEDLLLHAEASTNGSAIPVEHRDVPISSADLPESIVRYAARAHETVSLEDASARGRFVNDEYIRRERARSVLCLPLLQQGRLMAVLYLENNLAASVFTPARMSVLNVLASQAATSLEKTRLYEELRQREAKIRRLVDANIVGVLVSTVEGPVIEANDAFLRMLGYSRDDLTSGLLRWTELTPPDWRAVTDQAIAQLAAHGTCDLFEKEYVRKDGSRVPVLVAAAAIEGRKGENVAFVLDLTDRKRAEQERERLRQLQARLAHVNRVTTMGQLAASLTHEIKQPIAAAGLDATVCVRALADESLDIERARRAAARMVKNVARTIDVMNRTSALFRKETTDRERLNINALIGEMADLLRQEASASSIAIRLELAEDVPDVKADRVQLQQVFMNLMANAVDAMKDTGGTLTFTSQVRDGREVLLGVSDTGVGLPADNPEQIFESFVTTKPQGTGMGLTITRSIVESHGGRLWAIANAGPGATFLFTLLIDAGE